MKQVIEFLVCVGGLVAWLTAFIAIVLFFGWMYQGCVQITVYGG